MNPTSTLPPDSPWTERLTARARSLRRSAVRELLKVTTRPDLISFAGGLPAAELFPVDEVRLATETVLRRNGGSALQYGETEGLGELRDRLAAGLPGGGVRGWSRENVVITSGGQQALDLLGRVLVDEGDAVLVENPTYLALLSAWGSAGARFHGVPGDGEGLRIDALPPADPRPAKLLYTVPNFQNPQGTTLAADRRVDLVRWARAAGVGIVEDDPYGELWYDREPGPSLLELDAEAHPGDGVESGNVLRCGTFSKVLAPGLRVGWVVGPRTVVERLVLAKQSADLHTGTLNQWVALELLANGSIEARKPRLRAEYRRRRDAMLDALDRHFPADTRWTRPAGGMFVFVTLPEGLDAAARLPRALERGVAFVPGESFHVDGGGRNTLRLNFTHPEPARIAEGVRRLATVLTAD